MLKKIANFLLLFVLTACNNSSKVVSSFTATPDRSATSSSLPTSPQSSMNFHCLDIAEHPPLKYTLKGVLVFNNSDNTSVYLWDNTSKKKNEFPRGITDRLLSFDVSPNRKYISYLQMNGTKDELVVAAADGQILWSQTIDSYLWKWFDNDRLIGLKVKNNYQTLILLNPFTGEQQELRTDYPDAKVFSRDWFPGWKYTKGGLPLYNPTLTRVIYPECNSECQERLLNGESVWTIAIWSIEKKQVIARITTMDVYGETPQWTPDGKQFIFASNLDPTNKNPYANEYFAINQDGRIRQLTHLADHYKEVYIPDNYSLSPDGNKLAFWITDKTKSYEDASLAVLNIETSEVTNYCIEGNADSVDDPIWSPDGTQLLVISQGKQTDNRRLALLVDLTQDYAAQIAENITPIGWMVSP